MSEAANELTTAADVVRAEFLRKAEWYDAMIASIESVIRQETPYDSYDSMDLAKRIANTIIGIAE